MKNANKTKTVDLKLLSEGLVPVKPDENVRPTRVVWRFKSNQFLTSRVFPTAEQAWAFAAAQADVVIVQDAREVPPKQDSRVHRAFLKSHKKGEGPTVEKILRLSSHLRQKDDSGWD